MISCEAWSNVWCPSYEFQMAASWRQFVPCQRKTPLCVHPQYLENKESKGAVISVRQWMQSPLNHLTAYHLVPFQTLEAYLSTFICSPAVWIVIYREVSFHLSYHGIVLEVKITMTKSYLYCVRRVSITSDRMRCVSWWSIQLRCTVTCGVKEKCRCWRMFSLIFSRALLSLTGSLLECTRRVSQRHRKHMMILMEKDLMEGMGDVASHDYFTVLSGLEEKGEDFGSL